MLKIGMLANLSRVSVKTLRYYDQIGLLKPAEIDVYTGYRYYSINQYPRLNRILALKDLDLSLEQIAQLLDEDLPAAQLRGMLRLKQVEIHKRMEVEMEKLARVEARLEQIEQEDEVANYDVVFKKIEPSLVASVRDMIPNYPQQGHLWDELETYLYQHKINPIGPCLTLYHSEEPDIDAEVCEPVDEAPPPQGRVKFHELPGVESMACLVHHGTFVTIGESYTAILKWIEANGYQVSGPPREVYLQPAKKGSQTDPNTVTEIQFPVEKP